MKIIEPNYEWLYKPTFRTVTTELILHHSAGRGTAEGIHAYHRSLGWSGIAYHYYVRMDGSIYRGRPENWQGGHTEGYNHRSIGICFEGNFEKVDEMPQAQRDAGRELVRDIVKRYPGINVGLHKQYNATSCPGAWFPAQEIIMGKPSPEPEGETAEVADDPPAWARDACDQMVELGIIKGDGKSYHWAEPITRAELAIILDRILRLGR